MGFRDPEHLRGLALSFAFLGVPLAGCLSGSESEAPARFPSRLVYALETSDGWNRLGTDEWATDGQIRRFLGADLRWKAVVPIAASLRLDTGEGATWANATAFYDPNNRTDVAIVQDCLWFGTPEQCPQGYVEWKRHGYLFAWFGAPLLPGLARLGPGTSNIHFAGVEHGFDRTPLEDGDVRLTPQGRSDRFLAPCNVLEDVTVVDLERNLVVECWTLLGNASESVPARLRLASPRAPISFEALWTPPERPEPPPWGSLERRSGPLPPGSNYAYWPHRLPLQEAHEAAVANSKGLADFLAAHPEAALEEARDEGAATRSVGGAVVSREATYALRYVGSGGAGYEAVVTRTDTDVNGVRIARTYAVDPDRDWQPPPEHRWNEMPPLPEQLAPIRGLLEALDAATDAWRPHSVSVFNVAQAGEPGPRLHYRVSLESETCGEESCLSLESLAFDASSGLLEVAQLAGERLGGLVE